MAYVISPAQVAPYIPVQHQLFKRAFVTNYRRVRSLQRDSVHWFTSSRNYRFLTAIGAASLLVLGAAICQLKAADYSSLFVHRSGANFVWSLTSLIFCTLEFARIFRKRDGLWTWEVGCGFWLAVSIVISSLALANNVAGTIDLVPKIYRTQRTTPFPYYYGMTTARFPEPGEQTIIPGMVMTTGLIMNEWDTYQWSTWRKAVFVLYCFCTILIGAVLLLCYVPYIFFKYHEYKLGYGRRLLSNGQIVDVTKNAVQAYKAAVYNRERLQQVIDDRTQPVDETLRYPGTPGPLPVEGYPGPPPAPPSTVSSGNFKHANQYVKPKKTAWFPVFQAPASRAPSYYSYEDEDYSYYTATPTSYDYYGPTEYNSDYYSRTGSRTGTSATSASSATLPRPRPAVPRSRGSQSGTTSYYYDDDNDTFTEYIPVNTTDYTERRIYRSTSSTTGTTRSGTSRSRSTTSGTTRSSSYTTATHTASSNSTSASSSYTSASGSSSGNIRPARRA